MNGLIPKVYAQTLTLGQPVGFRVNDIGQIITAAVSLLLIIAAILAFVYLVLGGIQWITSGGDKAGMEAARNKITHAVVGLIVVGAAYAIMILAQNFLGISLFGAEGGVKVPTPAFQGGSDFTTE